MFFKTNIKPKLYLSFTWSLKIWKQNVTKLFFFIKYMLKKKKNLPNSFWQNHFFHHENTCIHKHTNVYKCDDCTPVLLFWGGGCWVRLNNIVINGAKYYFPQLFSNTLKLWEAGEGVFNSVDYASNFILHFWLESGKYLQVSSWFVCV